MTFKYLPLGTRGSFYIERCSEEIKPSTAIQLSNYNFVRTYMPNFRLPTAICKNYWAEDCYTKRLTTLEHVYRLNK